jgi:hypothetical protein
MARLKYAQLKKLSLTLLALLAAVGLAFSLLHFYYQLPVKLALADALVHMLLLSALVIALANTFRYYRPATAFWLVAFLLPLPLVYLALSLSTFLSLEWLGSAGYQNFLEQSQVFRGVVGYLVLAASAGWAMLWGELQRHKKSQTLQMETQQLAREAELYKLRQQLQPHFLFNALNSINALMATRQKEARHMLLKLSDFLRTTVSRQDETLISLAEELEHIRLYLAIELTRFGHRLQVEEAVKDNALGMQIPPLLLQPLIENAIKFGLYGTIETLTIRLKADAQPGHLLVQISNPFLAEEQPPSGTGFGLKGLRRRLFLLYGRNDLLQTQMINKTFTVTLKIPQK